MTALPTELLFTVLERLNGEKVALSIISLTGRTLLTPSRAILFQSVCLHPANTSSFIELLTSPYTTLPPAVRQLSLLQRLDPDISETSVSDDADGPEWLDKSIDVLARLRCVDVLQIDRIEWCQLAPATRTTLTTSFSGITRFRLSAVAMDTLDDLVALVCAFPHLETLALDDIGWDVPDASPSHQFPVGLRRLHLGSLYKRDLLEWMRARSPVPLVKHLSLGAVSPADAQEIGEYVAVANSQLQSLRVAFNSLDAGGDAGTPHFPFEILCRLLKCYTRGLLKGRRPVTMRGTPLTLDRRARVLCVVSPDQPFPMARGHPSPGRRTSRARAHNVDALHRRRRTA